VGDSARVSVRDDPRLAGFALAPALGL